MEARMDGTLEQRLLWRVEALREALSDIGTMKDGVSHQISRNALSVDDENAKLCIPTAAQPTPDPFNRKQVEAVCRAVCKVEGVDPDDDTFGDGCDPVWTRYADAVADALAAQPPAAPVEAGDYIDPITAEEYFRGTLKVIAHWAEVDLSGEWETGLRGIIRSITDAAKETLSAHPEGKSHQSCSAETGGQNG